MTSLTILVNYIYHSLPIVAVVAALLQARRRDTLNPLRDIVVTLFAGAIAGWTLVWVYSHQLPGRMPATQYFIAAYWGASVSSALRLFNAVLSWGFGKMTPSLADGRAVHPTSAMVAQVIRAAVLLAVAAPYLGGMLLSYRPKMIQLGDPGSVLQMDYQPVAFRSTDGLTLSAWWIPAARTSRTDEANIAADWGKRTVIVCHGFAGDKTSALKMARDLAPNGYNVLAFDFRAHGQSEGQLTTFGDLERRDVLGAVRWLRATHPTESAKIFGVGENLGAAALISAAGEPGDGQCIDAIALFAPYDRLTNLIQDVADTYSIHIGGWLTTHLALPMSGWQAGTHLSHFAPGIDVDRIAPRPIFIIANNRDFVVDINRSRAFYDEASQPKYAYWINRGTERANHAADARATKAVRVFFESARSIL
jgi:pimeloyl-ACP methyl ester carboxylesterase